MVLKETMQLNYSKGVGGVKQGRIHGAEAKYTATKEESGQGGRKQGDKIEKN